MQKFSDFIHNMPLDISANDPNNLSQCACYGGNHVFIFSGSSSTGRVPDGTPCDCGAVTAKWVECSECGHDVLECVPITGSKNEE
jgi:hypothetical protein